MSKIKRFFLPLLFCGPLLSGCMSAFNPHDTNRLLANIAGNEQQRKMTVAEAQIGFSDLTRLSISHSHGGQITHTTSDGRSYLWYPGNAVVLQGRWKIEDGGHFTLNGRRAEFVNVCLMYGPNTYNPATGSRGEKWECQAAGALLGRTAEKEKGDVFGLSKHAQTPFILTRDIRNFAGVRAKMTGN